MCGPALRCARAYDPAARTFSLTLEQVLPETPDAVGATKVAQLIPVAVGRGLARLTLARNTLTKYEKTAAARRLSLVHTFHRRGCYLHLRLIYTLLFVYLKNLQKVLFTSLRDGWSSGAGLYIHTNKKVDERGILCNTSPSLRVSLAQTARTSP